MRLFTPLRLLQSQRPKNLYFYKVTGGGAFPFDMLRYDAAWPSTTQDASKLVEDDSTPFKKREVTLQSYREPTVDRWKSFAWVVGDVEAAWVQT